jgi:DNA-binding NtrC family response regulator/tetratricopeptide (TPR) repeat protein
MSGVQAALARARGALERGRALEAVQHLQALYRSGSLARDDESAVRIAITEGHLLADDLGQAAVTLGRSPDTLKDPPPPATLSTLWRLHGRLSFSRGDQSRAIANHTKALKFAELARDSRAIGLAHYELSLCYRQVGDAGIVREHLTKAAAALHASGDKRHLALVHRLSGVLLGQAGRIEDAAITFRQAERLATAIRADDVLASIAHNRANLGLITRHLDDARVHAERSVALYEQIGSGHGLAVSLATLGQVYVQLGDLDRAEQTLNRALQVRSPIKFNETTGAVFDTLAQIHLMRGDYDRASEYLKQAGEAYGAQGPQAARWYEWSVKVLEVKIATRRGAYEEAVALADELSRADDIPPTDAIQADLAACEALLAAGRAEDARRRLAAIESRFDPRSAPANWGEFLRVRGTVHARLDEPATAYHDFAQSATVFELLGERYQTATSHLALAKLASKAGARRAALRSLDVAGPLFSSLGAEADVSDVRDVRAALSGEGGDGAEPFADDAEDAVVRRLVDASLLPELLARELAAVAAELPSASGAVVVVRPAAGEPRVVAASGLDALRAAELAQAAAYDISPDNGSVVVTERLGADVDGPRLAAVAFQSSPSSRTVRRLKMIAAVGRQGYELCSARERPAPAAASPQERAIELLLPGFICASAAMTRVADQIQRLQGQMLTVLITGESGTGKDLVARAIHVGSPRSGHVYLPFNCTTTTRELADSQLFGHRRGSFTGAVSDQPGIIRSADGGTLFLDEIGDIPLDVQPKLLRFLEQAEIIPVGDPRPISVDVRVLAATNADLEQRVNEGRFREDLYYRLSIIKIDIPPLRERREEIPHLCTFFLRDSSEQLDRPDVQLSSSALDLLTQYWWPGNVRQLRNEIKRAVAMSPPGGLLEPEHFSPELSASRLGVPESAAVTAGAALAIGPANLAEAIERLEREMISATLDQTRHNISEAARLLGLTRRGLYLKLARLGIAHAAANTK